MKTPRGKYLTVCEGRSSPSDSPFLATRLWCGDGRASRRPVLLDARCGLIFESAFGTFSSKKWLCLFGRVVFYCYALFALAKQP